MQTDVRRRRRKVRAGGRRVVVARLLMVWVALVTLYFLWEADHYTGLYAFLAEWQYDHLSRHFPILTFGLLVIVFGWPAAFLLKSRRGPVRVRRSTRPDNESSEERQNRRSRAIALRASSNFRRTLFAFAGGLGLATVIVLLWTLTLPRVGTPTEEIAVRTGADFSPPTGNVTLKGAILYDRTSAFAQSLFVTARGIRFAPMIEPGDRGRTLRVFVELPPRGRDNPGAVQPVSYRSGVLMRNNLPGSIVRLYRYAGYDVPAPFYVLYTSSTTIRWPYYVTAAQLLIAALLALVAGLVQHRHIRHIAGGEDSRRAGQRSVMAEAGAKTA